LCRRRIGAGQHPSGDECEMLRFHGVTFPAVFRSPIAAA
jgi:hypothetical protein